jgi:hypothetical protein
LIDWSYVMHTAVVYGYGAVADGRRVLTPGPVHVLETWLAPIVSSGLAATVGLVAPGHDTHSTMLSSATVWQNWAPTAVTLPPLALCINAAMHDASRAAMSIIAAGVYAVGGRAQESSCHWVQQQLLEEGGAEVVPTVVQKSIPRESREFIFIFIASFVDTTLADSKRLR